jgi:hypothetical protein
VVCLAQPDRLKPKIAPLAVTGSWMSPSDARSPNITAIPISAGNPDFIDWVTRETVERSSPT